jgi:acetyltransferase-like isoleucine patch superfamily enzyme
MWERLSFYVRSVICTTWFRLRGVRVSSWIVCQGWFPRLEARGEIIIGEALIVRNRILPCELGAVASAYLHIGDRVSINQGAVVTAHYGIEIGDDAMIGEFAAIYDTNHHPVDEIQPIKYAPVIIGTNVWLGRNVTVLPGSTIGDHTVVAAGSVVKGELPPRVLAVGNPARPVREVAASDGWRRGNRDGTHPKSRPMPANADI